MPLEYGRMLLNIGFRAVSACIPGGALVHLTIEEFGPAFCSAVWEKFGPWTASQRQTALEQMGQLSVDEARKIADEAVPSTGIDPGVRAQVIEYLAAVPMAARRTLVQDAGAGAQGGLSLPSSQVPRSQSELLRFLPLRPPRFSPGHLLAGHDYRLERLLGQGGFGEVWLASNPRRPRQAPRALKFCLDEPMRQSLERETDLLDRIEESRQHPGIVRLLGTALSAEPPFLTYEFVDGGDLTNWISVQAVPAPSSTPSGNGGAPPSTGPKLVVPAAKVAALLVQVADALGFAHGLGLIHRDLKPSNVLIDHTGVVKLTDFGIGSVVAEQELARAQKQTRTTVQHSTLHGACTPMYADRAQRRGESVDARADVYAVGVMAYQLLLGDVTMELSPYFRDELEEAGVPAELIAVVAACVALPERRLRDGGALLAALEPVARKLTGATPAADLGKKSEPLPPKRGNEGFKPAGPTGDLKVPEPPKPLLPPPGKLESLVPKPEPSPPKPEPAPPPTPEALGAKPLGRRLKRGGIVLMALSVLGYASGRGSATFAEAQMVFVFGAVLMLVGLARARVKNKNVVRLIAFAGVVLVIAMSPRKKHDQTTVDAATRYGLEVSSYAQNQQQVTSYVRDQPQVADGNFQPVTPSAPDHEQVTSYALDQALKLEDEGDSDDETEEPEPPTPPSAGMLDLSGTWQGSPGLSYTVQQQGNQIFIQEISAQYGFTGGQGQGTLSGSVLSMEYRTSTGGVGRGELQVSPDGRHISGAFTDPATGAAIPTMLYR